MLITDFSKYEAGLSFTNSSDIGEREAFAYNIDWSNGYFTLQNWKNYISNFDVNCLTNIHVNSCKGSDPAFNLYDSQEALGSFCVPSSPKPAMLYNKLQYQFHRAIAFDFKVAFPILVYVALLSLLLSLAFFVVVSFGSAFFSFFIIIALGLVLIIVGILLFISYAHTGFLNDPFNALRINYLNFLITHKYSYLFLAFFTSILGIVVLIIFFKYRLYIHNAIPLLTLASRSTLKNFMLLVLSVMTLMAAIFVFFWEIYILMLLWAAGTETTNHEQG